ncbi:MAG: tRNA pseudouridine(38-40) synthase TruA [Candidatus Omnitrophica bacterium]|nr:tRNA pseudouridine(38-40) synthase TruA [Candidatus Omnitrophota bacterium]
MEQNICAEVQYDGTGYYGFQIQRKKSDAEITVESVLREAFSRLFGAPLSLTYASRTDRGVHAKAQVVSARVHTDIPLSNIPRALNSFLPPDIRILHVKNVPLEFHARYHARSKQYRYFLYTRQKPSVFWRRYSWYFPAPLDISAMQRAGAALCGRKDFRVFAKQAKVYPHCERTLRRITVRKRGPLLLIDLEADAFLRGMARNIVGLLVKAGTGKQPPRAVKDILRGNRLYHNVPAPAHGLFLMKVNYEVSRRR